MKLLCKSPPKLAVLVLTLCSVTSHAQQASESANCGLPPSQKVDEYLTLEPAAERERLEKFLMALGLQKNSHGFIVTYAGRDSTLPQAQARADWAKRYLVERHTFFAGAEGTNSHLNALTCGFREADSTELWITPEGAAPPRCASTISGPAGRKLRTRRTRG